MASWQAFAESAPELAEAGKRLCMIEDPTAPVRCGLAYLATVKADGAPRVHPISPALYDDRLYGFILNSSPKGDDLLRDGRYALHSWPAPFPNEGFDDTEWYVEGRAVPIADPTIQTAVAAIVGEKVTAGRVFELGLDRVLYKHRVDGRITYDRWMASSSKGRNS